MMTDPTTTTMLRVDGHAVCMFRVTRVLPVKRGQRAWKGAGLPSASAKHFELTTLGKKKDIPMPAGGVTGISHSHSTSAKLSTNLLKRLFNSGAFNRMGAVGDWLQTIRFTEWRTISVLLYPSLWGVGLGTTRAFVLESADTVVLNVPLLPIHLCVQFFVGAWSARAAAFLWEEALIRLIDRKPPTTKMPTKTVLSAAFTHVLLCLGIAFNMHWTVAMLSCVLVPVAALYPVMWRLARCDTKPKLFARQVWLGAVSSAGAPLGYIAVVGRIDPYAAVGLWVSGTVLSIMQDSVELLRRDDVATSLSEIPYPLSDLKVVLSLYCNILFAGFAVAASVAGQSIFFHVAAGAIVLHLIGEIDHLNIADPWSCNNFAERLPTFGRYFIFAILLGNVWWWLTMFVEEKPLGTESRVGEKIKVDSTLKRVLNMNIHPSERVAEWSEISWFDRLMKPALAMAQVAQSKGEDIEIPAYMRREYLGENVVRALHHCFAEDRLQRWQGWWYAVSDHYNVFTKV